MPRRHCWPAWFPAGSPGKALAGLESYFTGMSGAKGDPTGGTMGGSVSGYGGGGVHGGASHDARAQAAGHAQCVCCLAIGPALSARISIGGRQRPSSGNKQHSGSDSSSSSSNNSSSNQRTATRQARTAGSGGVLGSKAADYARATGIATRRRSGILPRRVMHFTRPTPIRPTGMRAAQLAAAARTPARVFNRPAPQQVSHPVSKAAASCRQGSASASCCRRAPVVAPRPVARAPVAPPPAPSPVIASPVLPNLRAINDIAAPAALPNLRAINDIPAPVQTHDVLAAQQLFRPRSTTGPAPAPTIRTPPANFATSSQVYDAPTRSIPAAQSVSRTPPSNFATSRPAPAVRSTPASPGLATPSQPSSSLRSGPIGGTRVGPAASGPIGGTRVGPASSGPIGGTQVGPAARGPIGGTRIGTQPTISRNAFDTGRAVVGRSAVSPNLSGGSAISAAQSRAMASRASQQPQSGRPTQSPPSRTGPIGGTRVGP